MISRIAPVYGRGFPASVRAGKGKAVDWKWLGTRALLLLPFVHFLLFVLVQLTRETYFDTDLIYVFNHAEMVRSGATLYWDWPEYGPHFMTDGLKYPLDRFPYPPFLTPIMSLISAVGLVAFARVWTVVIALGYILYSVALGKLASGRTSLGSTMTAFAALWLITYPHAQSALKLGNVDPLLWAALGMALAYPAVRGIGFMLLTLVKLYGLWPLAVALVRKEYGVARDAAMTLLVACAIVSTIMGPLAFFEAVYAWLGSMLPVLGQGTFSGSNFSISFLGLRIAKELSWDYASGPLDLVPRLYLMLIGVAAPSIAAVASWRRSPELRHAVIVCAAIFFAPLAWNFYLPVLLAPAAILFREWHLTSPAVAFKTPLAGRLNRSAEGV